MSNNFGRLSSIVRAGAALAIRKGGNCEVDGIKIDHHSSGIWPVYSTYQGYVTISGELFRIKILFKWVEHEIRSYEIEGFFDEERAIDAAWAVVREAHKKGLL